MGLFRKSEKPVAPQPTPITSAEHRRAPRYSTAVVSCMLGQVVDLSSCGMRVRATKPPPIAVGDLVRLALESPTNELLVVGRVARISKRPGMGAEIAIEFQQLTPELSAALDCLARHGCVKGRKPAEGEQARIGITASARLPDLYELLGVAPGAPTADVHKAFREKARSCHPDLNPSPEAQAAFIELHKAYDVLKNPEKRLAYDAAWAAQAA